MKFSFDCVFYYVSDLDRAVDFYTRVLGFKLLSRDSVARFDIGGVLFELVSKPGGQRPQAAGNARLCLRVDNVTQAIGELQSQGVRVSPPEVKATGSLAFFQDPDGNEVCLWEYSK